MLFSGNPKREILDSHMTHRSVLVLADRGQLRQQHQQKQKRGGFTSAALLKQSTALPNVFFHKNLLITHNESLPSHLPLSGVFFLLNPSPLSSTESNGSISERRGKGFDLFFLLFQAFRSRGGLPSSSPNPRAGRDKEQTL